MQILILANNADGLYHFRGELINRILSYGHSVTVSVPFDDCIPELEALGCRAVVTPLNRRGMNPITDMQLINKYWKILNEIKPDMVITYTIKPNIYGCFVCRLKKIPHAANITGLGTAFQNEGILKKFVTALYKVALKNAQTVFFENSENMRVFKTLGICKKEEQCKLLNGAGVDLEHFRYSAYPEDDSPVHFLFIGRVMKEKGIDELFTAMKQLHQEGRECVLDVLGYYEENFASDIEQYQTEGWLNYYGYQKDVRPFIEKCHCFVLPSWHEGMANTNLECAAMGRPLITSNIPGCREAVVEDKSGYLCERKNANSLYHAMARFLSLTQEERKAMGRLGRLHMEDVFDKKMVVAETLEGLGLENAAQVS